MIGAEVEKKKLRTHMCTCPGAERSRINHSLIIHVFRIEDADL